MKLGSLDRRLRNKARKSGIDVMARADPLKYKCFRDINKSPTDMTRADVRSAWTALCRRKRRIIPVPESGTVPILKERDVKIRDAGVKWYAGSFPGMPDDLKAKLGHETYQRTKARIEIGMGVEKWSQGARKRTVDSIRVLLDARGKVESPEGPHLEGRRRGTKRQSEVSESRRRSKRSRRV